MTIAEDLSNEPVLKVWALDKTEKKDGGPKCLSTLSIHNGRKQFPVRRRSSCHAVAMVLTAADLRLCSSGEPVAAGRWLCERLGHSHQRGLDT